MGTFAGKQLERWDIHESKSLPAVPAFEQGIHSMAFNPDGSLLATAGGDQVIHLWDAATLEPRGMLRGHEDEIWSVSFSPDGRQLLSSSKDGTVRIWPTNAPAPLIAVEPNGDVFFSADSSRLITVWPKNKHIWSTVDGRKLEGITNSQEIFPNTRQPEVGRMDNPDGTASIIDLETGQIRGTFPSDQIDVPNFVISPQSDFMVGVHRPSARVRLWDLKKQKLRFEWPLELPSSAGVVLSPDGKLLARIVTNYVLALHNTSTGEKVQSLAGAKWNIPGLAFSPDGKTFAGGSWDSKIYLWDVATGQLLLPPLRGHRRALSRVVFSPDGRTLISSSDDLTIRLWNVQTGQDLMVLEDAGSASMSPNGRYFQRLDLTGIERRKEPTLFITRLPTPAEAEERNRALTQYLNLD
jgi:WD40 repeat protein